MSRLRYLDEKTEGDFLFGPSISMADSYLFVMLLWPKRQGLEAQQRLAAFCDRMMQRPAVQKAMEHEGRV